MIAHLDISGVKYDIDGTTRRYVVGKIGSLDRYLPRHARKSVTAEVKLKEVNRSNGNKYECEVILHVPEHAILAKDSTVNMLAAVDIVEEKLKNQLKKYKSERITQRGAHGVLSRLKRSFQRS
ncbi:MAG TPA: ribosome-associated translation inhibitor RaiA [Candidatus Saccharimonadales bacterium]